MLYMNEYEIDHHVEAHSDVIEDLVALRGARILQRLADWADENSDGWAYWPKPARSAEKLMRLLKDRERRWSEAGPDADEGVTEADLRKALTPIKSMLTRVGATAADKRRIFGEA